MIYILPILFILSQIYARSTSEQILFAFIFAIFYAGVVFKTSQKMETETEKRKKYCYNFTK